MSDLAAFILARIAEDEAVATEAGGDVWEVADARKVRWVRNGGNAHGWAAFADLPTVTEHIARHDPARVLAECEAKRFVVDALRGYEPSDEWESEPDMGKRANNAAGALRRMALPYADHPDYDEAWRP